MDRTRPVRTAGKVVSVRPLHCVARIGMPADPSGFGTLLQRQNQDWDGEVRGDSRCRVAPEGASLEAGA